MCVAHARAPRLPSRLRLRRLARSLTRTMLAGPVPEEESPAAWGDTLLLRFYLGYKEVSRSPSRLVWRRRA